MPSILEDFHFEIQEPLAWGNPLWLLLSLTAKNQNMHFFQVLWLWSQQPVSYTLSDHACPPKHVTWTLVQSSIVKHILLFIYNNQVWLSISTPWRRQKGTFNQMAICFDTVMKHLQEAISQFRKSLWTVVKCVRECGLRTDMNGMGGAWMAG